jgi:hypothetical protein
MTYISTRKKQVAVFLLLILLSNILLPGICYALTSGPAQPETKGFQPAGVSDMVDLESGDFKYNIPLLDIDGYPINLNYQSGVSMDDEASWVGLGWSLNPGAINRQVRGLPDDFNGDDVKTSHYTKPMVTIGGRLTGKVEVFGIGEPKGGDDKRTTHLGASGSMSVGVYKNNYTGIGAELAINAGMSLSVANAGTMTAGLGLSSDSQRGVDFSPNVSLSVAAMSTQHVTANAGLSASLGYNTRSGLKSLSLGSTFSADYASKEVKTIGGFGASTSGGTSISYNTEPINPDIKVPYISRSSTFSIDAGASIWGVFLSGGLSGYKNTREVLTENMSSPGYGFLYAESGKKNLNAVMDFIREKENPVVPELPNLAVPIQTPDLFSYTSQGGGGQFRLYRGGTGVFFDNQSDDQSENSSMGGDFGAGLGSYHGGVTYYRQNIHNSTHKWVNDNKYLNNGDFQDADYSNPNNEHVYFRPIGEKNQENDVLAGRLQTTDAVKLELGTDGKSTTGNFYSSNIGQTPPQLFNEARQRNRTVVSYLTASEARNAAVDHDIMTYPVNQDGSFTPPADHKVTGIAISRMDVTPDSQVGDIIHKSHHISEITVTDDGGKRMVYGIPVYNLKQDEYSFAIGSKIQTPGGSGDYNVVNGTETGDYSLNPQLGRGRGKDNYYHKESKPPYAASYLLTSILSPDYIDKTGDGISDDDLGTAVKFNYSKMPKAFKWRTPYQNATINKALLADKDDDKASIVYGEKELWYISTIESKTKIAYFITKERCDALGVDDWLKGGMGNDVNQLQRQRCLTEIRLYSKGDSKPIKVVKFEYGYDLCPGVPNFNDPTSTFSPGKLTLKRVWFEYGNISKGVHFPYVFHYDNTDDSAPNPPYGYMQTDRWGTYKLPIENNGFNLQNDEYPYTNQNKSTTDVNVAKWHLKQIDLPTGGTIKVNYEADDYTYVQNRKAMCMYRVDYLCNNTNYASNGYSPTDATALANATGIGVTVATLPGNQDPTTWFEKNYLGGSDYIYTKLYAKVKTPNYDNGSDAWDYDFVPCYAKIQRVVMTGNHANVFFEPIHEGDVVANPIAISAWQKIKNDYPRYAYPGYDTNTSDDQSGLSGAISAIITAAGNVSELLKSFYQTAQDNNYAGRVNLDKSFVRMTINNNDPNNDPTIKVSKVGGGARVKQISISDNWGGMSGNVVKDANGNAIPNMGTYGQSYDYTTTENGQKISSGVATYEPSIGSDENPFRQPVPYIENIKGGINNYFDLEEPFGESVFPAPSVTYGKVTVTDLADGQAASNTPKTGYIVNEFYTSKDFPVRVNVLPITTVHNRPNSYLSFIKTVSDDELTMSQGYSVELNDMNGKAKATRIFNQAGSQISSTEYYYKSKDMGGGEYALDNNVKIVNQDGTVSPMVLGRDIELFTDMREQESNNTGLNINLGVEVFTTFVIPVFIPHFPLAVNDDYKLFRSACAFKVVQSYAILDKVIKTDNGSSITTQNVAFDGLTGEALITKTQNEFNNDIYSVNIPAYWGYDGMGGAYKSSGIVLNSLTTDSFGEINQDYFSTLAKGDELLDISSENNPHYWVIENPNGTQYNRQSNGQYINVGTGDKKYLIDRSGNVVPNFNPDKTLFVKVLRSGYRNLLKESIGSLVCLNNPIGADNKLKFAANSNLTTSLKVIKASAVTYDENWYVEVPDPHIIENKHFPWQITAEDPEEDSNGTYQTNATGGIETAFNSNMYPWGYIDINDPMYNPSHDVAIPGTYNYGTHAPDYYHNSNFNKNSIDGDAHYASFPATFLQYALSECSIQPRFIYSNAAYAQPDKPFDPTIIHIPTRFYVSHADNYYVGYASTSGMIFSIDNWVQQKVQPISHVMGSNHWNWFISAPVYLSQGWHKLEYTVNGQVTSFASSITNITYNNAPIFGIEIYNFNGSAPSMSTRNVIYNSRTLADSSQVKMYITRQNSDRVLDSHYYWTNGTPAIPILPTPTSVNPYIYGFAGNWRPYKTKVIQNKRTYNDVAAKSVGVQEAGYIDQFYSYWYLQAGIHSWVESTSGSWVTANTVTQYDKYGQQLENVDALGRYSAAKFDFNGELPAAVASNAQNREIYANSFEDIGFVPGSSTSFINVPSAREFNSGGAALITAAVSHSGNSGVLLPTDVGIQLLTKTNGIGHKTQPYLEFDTHSQYTRNYTTPTVYTNGFEPTGGKKYIFNMWIKDGDPIHKTIDKCSLNLNINGVDQQIQLKCKAIVEEWKLVEGILDLTSLSNQIPITISIIPATGETVYVDDIRIHPFDSHMKTYTYDSKTLRLMAELDENGFATFYEYDNEGLLIRVKKETERGVMTLKESRSSYKRN